MKHWQYGSLVMTERRSDGSSSERRADNDTILHTASALDSDNTIEKRKAANIHRASIATAKSASPMTTQQITETPGTPTNNTQNCTLYLVGIYHSDEETGFKIQLQETQKTPK
jgi:hypothetical protein